MGNTVTAFSYDESRGVLKSLQTISTLPADFERTSYTAEVLVHPTGKFVYGSNRGHDSIAVFRVDGTTGKLTFVETELTQGKFPRNFRLDPAGNFLLAENQDSDSIVVFKIDQETGALSPTGHQVKVSKPCCIRMMPATAK
jgi:6-phosphogluconolactonase